jgi:hypothetical protein
MPLYIDIHKVPGATANDLAQAHAADMKVQDGLGVCCVKYWFNEGSGKVFCLIDAPSAEAANEVHARSHGLLAEKIIEVDPDMVEGLLGDGEVNVAGAVMMPNRARPRHRPAQRDVHRHRRLDRDHAALGDAAAMRLVNLHDEVVREALASMAGRVVKHTGERAINVVFLTRPSGGPRWRSRTSREQEKRRAAAARTAVRVRHRRRLRRTGGTAPRLSAAPCSWRRGCAPSLRSPGTRCRSGDTFRPCR